MALLFRLDPYPRPMIWAGPHLVRQFGRDEVSGLAIGESLEASTLPGMESWVRDGDGRRRRLADLLEEMGTDLAGPGWRPGRPFPLLVKRLDAGQRLSLQVHPDDRRARELEGAENGKDEAWVVLAAEEGAGVWAGLAAGVDRAALEGELESGDPMERVRFLELAVGDALPIPAGCIHAVGEGLLVFEVQQPSDHTYRIHDYGRLGPDGRLRALHHEKGLAVLETELRPEVAEPRSLAADGALRREGLVAMPSFGIERWRLGAGEKGSVEGGVLRVLHAVTGRGLVRGGAEEAEISAGASILAAAATPSLEVVAGENGPLELLVAVA
ncbi:MAG: type I phosphomannose isomerase catalytic subunit [Planctomycetota bacterium]